MNDIGKFQRDIQILTAELQEWDSIYRYTSVPHTKKQAQAQMEELQNKIQKLQKEIQILQGDNNV